MVALLHGTAAIWQEKRTTSKLGHHDKPDVNSGVPLKQGNSEKENAGQHSTRKRLMRREPRKAAAIVKADSQEHMPAESHLEAQIGAESEQAIQHLTCSQMLQGWMCPDNAIDLVADIVVTTTEEILAARNNGSKRFKNTTQENCTADCAYDHEHCKADCRTYMIHAGCCVWDEPTVTKDGVTSVAPKCTFHPMGHGQMHSGAPASMWATMCHGFDALGGDGKCPTDEKVAGYMFSHEGWWPGYKLEGVTASDEDCAAKCNARQGCVAFSRSFTNPSNCYTYKSAYWPHTGGPNRAYYKCR